MSLVRAKNTKPELLVRRTLRRSGYSFRLHCVKLPGKPDIVFPAKKKIIFVHGCFWHGHKCRLGRVPKSRLDYWVPKISYNNKRDRNNLRRLRRMGWRCLVLWECQLRDSDKLAGRLGRLMSATT